MGTDTHQDHVTNLTTFPAAGETTVARSSLACQSCRRRKAKCDRVLPQCLICSKSSQACIYPATRLKSGPKTGSLHQNSRKRARQGERRSSNQPDSDEGPAAFEQDRDRARGSFSSGNGAAFPTNLGSNARGASATFSAASPVHPPISPIPTESTESSSMDCIQLSYVIHPTHGTSLTPPASNEDQENGLSFAPPSDILIGVCSELSISMVTMRRLIDTYFSNMMAFSLFHRPSFATKIQNIASPKCLMALLAAMFSFSARFEPAAASGRGPGGVSERLDGEIPHHETFHEQARTFIEDALNESGDESPPFCILQALTLTAFYQLTKGVRGRAWRLLGSCVRIAYEKNLHMVDSGFTEDDANEATLVDDHDIKHWCFEEERRRCWWAIWEMDTFASTIRRYPTAIDWTQNETCLPIRDDLWFNCQQHRSCLLQHKPTDRWKALQKSGNDSPFAWFIVVNSLMRDAHIFSYSTYRDGRAKTAKQRVPVKPNIKIPHEGLQILDHTVNCFTVALPEQLQWHGEYLNFTAAEPEMAQAAKRLDCAKYSIFLMTQLAKFMIYHKCTFGEDEISFRADKAGHGNFSSPDTQKAKAPDSKGLTRSLKAADDILAIINSCANSHIQYVNPFLASTVWMACAVQLVHKAFGPSEVNKDLIESRFDILYIHSQQYHKFWNTPITLLQHLDVLKKHLESPTAFQPNRLGMGADRPLETYTNSTGPGRVPGTSSNKASNKNTQRSSDNSQMGDERIPSEIFRAPNIANMVMTAQLTDGETQAPEQLNGLELAQDLATGWNEPMYMEMGAAERRGNSNSEMPEKISNGRLNGNWDEYDFNFGMESDLPLSLNGLLYECFET